MSVQKRKIAKYMLLPGLLPRAGNLFGTGFYHIAFLIAIIFQSVRLLPRDHPYLTQENLGRFGIRQVIAESAKNLKFNRANIDQVIIFFTVLTGMVLLVLQIILIGIALFSGPVFAGAVDFANWFTIPSPNYAFDERYDIALILLDRIFGVEGIFNSCVSTAIPCIDHNGIPATAAFAYPAPLHLALHSLLRMYSIGIGIMALMIIVYLTITIIGETAVTGTPFGQRFNRAWAPVRLIAFFALLAPLNFGGQNEGLNGGQLITLWTAKFGSNFATNAWGVFNVETARAYYQPEELIAVPGSPDFSNMAQFWTIANACIHAQKIINNRDIYVYLVRDDTDSLSSAFGTPTPLPHPGGAMPFNPPTSPPSVATPAGPGAANALYLNSNAVTGTDAMVFNNNSPAQFVVGEYDDTQYRNYRGSVKPICGEIVIPMNSPGWPLTNVYDAGAVEVFNYFFYMMHGYFTDIPAAPPPSPSVAFRGDIIGMAQCTIDREVEIITTDCEPSDPYPDYQTLIRNHLDRLNVVMLDVKRAAVNAQLNPAAIGYADPYLITDQMVQVGWAGAAIWYNRIAQMNSSLAAAMFARPFVKTWPEVMESVKAQQMQNNENLTLHDMFSPSLPNGDIARLPGPQDPELAAAYYNLFMMWSDGAAAVNPDTGPVGNPIIDAVNAIFGTQGLFDMRRPAPAGLTQPHSGNADLADPYHMTVHPLALLSSLGSSMVQASIQNLGAAAGGSLGSGLLSILTSNSNNSASALMSTAASFLGTVASVTILMGFMLSYVVPMMPFIYYFFALGGWVKSIFEAIVAIPIWALGHLRIDGEGLPGRGASNGYFLLLEIFIRPILIFIGLISSIIIFAAMVQILNIIFDIMINNIGGASMGDPVTPADIEFFRGPIDELFFSVMYVIIVYMMGLSCFKMIDQVPNNILRWMGVSVQTFKEAQGDPAGRLAQSAYQKGQMGIGQVSGAFEQNSGRLAAIASMG